MPQSSDVVNAPIAVLNLPDLLCVKDLREFLSVLPNYLVALIPTSVTNVIISPSQPLEGERSSLWIRLSNSGGFLGFYVFTGGQWTAIFPVPNSVIAIFRNPGDPTTPPAGYTRLDDLSGVVMDPTIVTAREATWVPDTSMPGEYLFYEALFTGF